MAALLVFVATSSMAGAVTLYKLVDRDGKVSYVQEVPASFQGKSVTVEIDTAVNSVAPNITPKPPQKAEKAAKPGEPKPMDYLAKRRATRDALELRLKTARDRLDAAKKALAGLQMGEDEFQVVMRPVTASAPGGGAPRNKLGCQSVVRNGRAVHACGAVAPNEKFVQRANALEEAVKTAEAEVEEAEIAWRRGVD